MAIKISELPAGGAISGGGSTTFEAVQGGVSVKLTDDQLRTWALSGSVTISQAWTFNSTIKAGSTSGLSLNANGKLYDVAGVCTVFLAEASDFRIYNQAASAVLYTGTAAGFLPGSDNVATLGHASFRFSTVYAGTGTINTSDETLKADVRPIPDAVLDAWSEVEFMEYRWKLGGKRLHIGVIAQRIEQVFERHGLDAFAYGLLCRDGNLYSVRPDECHFLEAALMRRELKRLKSKRAA